MTFEYHKFDHQYWAEKALVDATIPEDAPAWALPARIGALDEIYLDFLERLND